MSGFVSKAPATIVDPAAGVENDTVTGDGFYPDLSIAEARETMRFTSTIAQNRMRSALRAAIETVRGQLVDWRIVQAEAGYATLEAVAPGDTIDALPRTAVLYRRAVHSFAAADLVETHNDVSATIDGKDRAEERALSSDEHRRNGVHAVRDLLGVGRISVELI